MYDYSDKTINVSSLVNQINQGKINFDIAIQRGDVWDSYRKSLLINTILEHMPIEPLMFVYDTGAKKYYVIQGKQRGMAIYNYVNGGYKLHANTPPVIDENGNVIEIAKKKFKDLPEDFQNTIKERGLAIWVFNDITQDEIDEVFFRINNGKALTSIELTRTKMENLDAFQKIAEHPAISIAVSESARKKYIDEQIAIYLWIICFKANPSFLTKDIRKDMECNNISEDQINEVLKSLDYLEELYRQIASSKVIFRKMKTRTHVVSLVYMAFLSIKNGITVEEYIEKASKLFSTDGKQTTVSEEYNVASGSGSAKPEQVRIRMQEVEKALLG